MARAKTAKRKLSFGTSMGVPSVIAILVIMILVVFSALSITTSNADLRLSQKTSDSVKAFYEADAVAEDKMAEVAALLAKGGDWHADALKAGFHVSSDGHGGTLVSYTMPVDEYRNLDVELFAGTDGTLSRRLWHVVPASVWVADDSLNLAMSPN